MHDRTLPLPPKTQGLVPTCKSTGNKSLDYAGPQVSVAVIIVTIIAVVYCCVLHLPSPPHGWAGLHGRCVSLLCLVCCVVVTWRELGESLMIEVVGIYVWFVVGVWLLCMCYHREAMGDV